MYNFEYVFHFISSIVLGLFIILFEELRIEKGLANFLIVRGFSIKKTGVQNNSLNCNKTIINKHYKIIIIN